MKIDNIFNFIEQDRTKMDFTIKIHETIKIIMKYIIPTMCIITAS